MAAYELPQLARIDADALARFRRDGFLVVERFLPEQHVAALRDGFSRLFAGRFDTGIYPDEWYWREGMSLPDVTRYMASAWKADLTVARLALSVDVGRAAARLARTCGRSRYCLGHSTARTTNRAQMKAAAAAAGVAPPDPVFVEVPAGSCVFHAGEIWHGSGPNTTGNLMRRSIGIHLVPAEARFSDYPGGYIYRRYQRTGDPSLDESFFPVLWSETGHRTDWIAGYCATGRRQPGPSRAAA